MHIVISLDFCGLMPSSFPIVFGNMVGKVNDGMCVSGGSFWGVEGTGESDR